MKLTFHGAARSVTGSRHLLETGSSRILLDCGMFQGRREEAEERNRLLGFEPREVDTVLLSHAHIDHSGALPVMARQGFRGSVYLTRPTGDLTRVMLEDSARIQESDCAYVNKNEGRRGRRCREPLYDADDVRQIARCFRDIPYDQETSVKPRITVSFHDAGHILGSAAVRLQLRGRGGPISVLFTGDLGRRDMPILRDPAPPPPCDVLIIESTYGDRVHEDRAGLNKTKALEILSHVIRHRGKIIVPAFAVGRTQDIIMRIKELVDEGVVDPIPIYIDSPLAFKATEIFRRHPEVFDEETYRTFAAHGNPFAARYIRYVSSIDESKKLNAIKGPCVIISASGMCEGGRVVHHLKHAIEDPANVIAIVGFQAEHTLGRKLVEGWPVVPIFGKPVPLRARVERFNGLSAHADRNDLLAYVRAIAPPPAAAFVVHGEEKQSLALAQAIQEEFPKMRVTVPRWGSTHDL